MHQATARPGAFDFAPIFFPTAFRSHWKEKDVKVSAAAQGPATKREGRSRVQARVSALRGAGRTPMGLCGQGNGKHRRRDPGAMRFHQWAEDREQHDHRE
jgi:hypothetical protein